MAGLRVGDSIPDLKLRAAGGRFVGLKDLAAKTALVLFFYPRDASPICTVESCAFRDSYQVLKGAGAEVIGISGDSLSSHESFSSRHSLPYLLLSDEAGTARAAFGIKPFFGIFPRRVTFVISKGGLVRSVFESQFRGRAHVEDALRALQEDGNSPAVQSR